MNLYKVFWLTLIRSPIQRKIPSKITKTEKWDSAWVLHVEGFHETNLSALREKTNQIAQQNPHTQEGPAYLTMALALLATRKTDIQQYLGKPLEPQ